jgi:hypothetical protein
MGECGESALPYLRTIIADPNLRDIYPGTIEAMSNAGGKTVVPEFIALLEAELAFWKQRAPKLHVNWRNGTEIDEVEKKILLEKYSYALQLVFEFSELKSPQCIPVVTAFCGYWRSLPQLEGTNGRSQMSSIGDNIIADLKREDNSNKK